MFFIGFLANTLPQTMGPVCWFGILHDLSPPPPCGWGYRCRRLPARHPIMQINFAGLGKDQEGLGNHRSNGNYRSPNQRERRTEMGQILQRTVYPLVLAELVSGRLTENGLSNDRHIDSLTDVKQGRFRLTGVSSSGEESKFQGCNSRRRLLGVRKGKGRGEGTSKEGDSRRRRLDLCIPPPDSRRPNPGESFA